MNEQQDNYADLVSIAAAAKNVRLRRAFVKEFAEKRGLVVQHGKRIKIPLTELRRHLASRNPPKNHPLVKC